MTRTRWSRPSTVRPGMIVGDLGPGYGHFTLRLARAVEPDGAVYALDASQSTLDDLIRAAGDRGMTTLRAVLVPRDRVEIPEPVDLLFVSATYHHLPRSANVFHGGSGTPATGREGGHPRVAPRRLAGPLVGRHATSPRRLLSEMATAGYRLTATHDVVRGYWYGLFEVDPGG